MRELKIRRALLSVSDKTGLVELARALHAGGTELVATGGTASILREAGFPIVPIEAISGAPEAFQGRMKTLSFPVFSGILHRRGDEKDAQDMATLSLKPIDCVVVNFYPFERAAARSGISESELIEEIDIGGPSLVRAASKNSPDVLVLTDPAQYPAVIAELSKSRSVGEELVRICASRSWDRVLEYDRAIAERLGQSRSKKLRYGENPHQEASIQFDPAGPVAWDGSRGGDLSYNNILDLSAAYALASDLAAFAPECTSVVIVKHGNPCGVASVPRDLPAAQERAFARAWEGDPVSAFGGVLVFTEALSIEAARALSEKFVEVVAAPALTASESCDQLFSKRKNLKAVSIRRFGESPTQLSIAVPGGVLRQSADIGMAEEIRSVSRKPFPRERERLARFAMIVCRALKSNAVAIARDTEEMGGFQLIGAGQGQPNRVEALNWLAIPRALRITSDLGNAVLASDAFFPFRDTVDGAAKAGLKLIIQPGGSVRDQESITACDEQGVAMAFTGVRHFRH